MHQPRQTQDYPKIWLITDKRNDAVLESSIRALPRGSGIVFRHYHLSQMARYRRFKAIQSIARPKGHLLLLADSPALARLWGANGVYGRHHRRRDTKALIHGAPVHDPREIRLAKQNGADLFFLSPAYRTASHPGKKALNRSQTERLTCLCEKPVVLLGGMDAKRFRTYKNAGPYGWAAIDALSG